MTAAAPPPQSSTQTDLHLVPMLSGGKWTTSASPRGGDVYNPSTGQTIARVPYCTSEEVDRTIEAAAAAFPAWAATPVVERCRYLFKFRESIDQHSEEIA